MPKTVKYIGGAPPLPPSARWGGGVATNTAFLKAFENDSEWRVIPRFRREFLNTAGTSARIERIDLQEIRSFIDGADVVHVDDTDIVAVMLLGGVVPDVIGPITRSPIKNYKGWDCPYGHLADLFYSAKVIRLNYSEERAARDRVTLIQQGIDTESLKPDGSKERKYILWAGNASRYAKNYDLFQEISVHSLPAPFEWKTMSGYRVQEYWHALDETAVLVNTSRYESFCAAMAEARAKGVPIVYKSGLHGEGVQADGEIQVEYTPEAYFEAISHLLADSEQLAGAGIRSREYAENQFSLRRMRDDIACVYESVVLARS